MKCVILQPSYIPWRGYFHQIHKANSFVFYDDVQYDKNGWRNRNRVKSPQGSLWLSVPVLTKGVMENRIPINRILIDWERDWTRKHLETLRHLYGRTPYFNRYIPLLEATFDARPRLLADLTIEIIVNIAKVLGIERACYIRSSDLSTTGTKTDRLLQILKKMNATHYISGPSAKSYLEEEKLQAEGISIEYMNYNYPEYYQLYPPYDPFVTILDLLFMMGPEAKQFIWGKEQ